jgi:hypothetical protein
MLIGDYQYRSKRQGRVGGGKQGGIKNLPRRGRPAVKFSPIPGSDPFLPENFPFAGWLFLGSRVSRDKPQSDKQTGAY